uniref:Uncharacterized protein n=1 Tax=Zea mays TaxID=4577 RepID=C4IYX6_MAIZE|nr:unknown [Zea mays]
MHLKITYIHSFVPLHYASFVFVLLSLDWMVRPRGENEAFVVLARGGVGRRQRQPHDLAAAEGVVGHVVLVAQ